ncbi:hypothetical protein [Streptomyces phaeoluteigriseus]|uniref:hypothetical protein n=1 Tax=Streptomyces phaeoluteigriseus TaxID=114686 RepID=UPI0009362087|nr:hypothetical protein [Streptomyces phaeoluteigriseus]
MSLSAAVDGSSTPPWPLVAALADQVVFFVGFYGSHRDKPAGPELGYHPALLIGACGAPSPPSGFSRVSLPWT